MSLMVWALVATCAAGAAVTAFLATYMVLAPWWRTQEGKNVVLLAAIIDLAVVLAIVGRLGFLDVARVGAVVVWFGVAVTFAWRTALVWRAQLANRRRPPAEG